MALVPKPGANAPPSATDAEATRQFVAWAEEHRVVGAGGSKSLHAIQRSLAPVNCCMVAVQVSLFQISTQF
jgi:hypothetical protein